MTEPTKSPLVGTTEAALPKPLANMSREERKQRYQQFKKKLGRSRLEIKGANPNLHYFWAPKDDDVEMVRLDYLGYHIVRCDNAKEILAGKAESKLQAAGLREDGTYTIGDVILMACPLEVYEFHMMDVEERSEAQIAAPIEQFRTAATQSGIPVFEPALAQKG
jgi:hypothetical protein